MTQEQKEKALVALRTATTANENASIALMACAVKTPGNWLRAFEVPMHVKLEYQAHHARAIREWLESQDADLE